MITIALALIVKNEADNIARVLTSVAGQVNKVYLTDTGSTDMTLEVAKAICKKFNLPLEVSRYAWDDNFSNARNYNFSQVKEDWILWLDADDTLQASVSLAETALTAVQSRATGVYATYDYFTINGITQVSHTKLRLVKNKFYWWEWEIHENLVPAKNISRNRVKELATKDFIVKHHKQVEELEATNERNYAILKKLIARKPDDLRAIYLLAREEWLLDKEKGVKLYKKFIQGGGTPQETVDACQRVCEYYEQKGMFKKMLKYAGYAIGIYPTHPIGYIMSAIAQNNRGFFEEAKTIIKKCPVINDLKDGGVSTTNYFKKLKQNLLIDLSIKLKDYKKAKTLLFEAMETAGEEEKKLFFDLKAKNNLLELSSKLIEGVKTELITTPKFTKEMVVRLNKLPFDFKLSETYKECCIALGNYKIHKKNSIVFYCSDSVEEWDGNSPYTTGIGGSETAVVEMAKRFASKGFAVSVYCKTDKAKKIEGVDYIPFGEINFADYFDTLIFWRGAGLTVLQSMEIVSNSVYMWLHDVPDAFEINSVVYNRLDKIIVLSKYQRTFLPDVPEHKFYYTNNGIDLEAIKKTPEQTRDKYAIAYGSAYNRGLLTILESWAEILKVNKNASLHIAYGWETMMKNPTHEKELFKAKIEGLMQQKNIHHYGRISKDELYKMYKRCGVWLYPTEFPEVNCITAQEAQACGCYPITSGYGAIEERQKSGVKDAFDTEAITTALKFFWAIDQWQSPKLFNEWSWDTTAKEWQRDLVSYEEDVKPLVTVFCPTARLGFFDTLANTLEKQSYKNFELVIVDKNYKKNEQEIESKKKQYSFRIRHFSDPERNIINYPYGLAHANNEGLRRANGELIVFLQDFLEVPENGIEKFVNHYKALPESLIGGVGKKDNEISLNLQVGVGIRKANVVDFELHWGAIPKAVLDKLGGFWLDFDKGFGADNVEIATRANFLGYDTYIDETNMAIGEDHFKRLGKSKGIGENIEKDNNIEKYNQWLKKWLDGESFIQKL